LKYAASVSRGVSTSQQSFLELLNIMREGNDLLLCDGPSNICFYEMASRSTAVLQSTTERLSGDFTNWIPQPYLTVSVTSQCACRRPPVRTRSCTS